MSLLLLFHPKVTGAAAAVDDDMLMRRRWGPWLTEAERLALIEEEDSEIIAAVRKLLPLFGQRRK